MKEVMHFKTQKERLDYLKGNYEEIIPVEASEEEEPTEEKKPKKSRKKGKKDDEVQAE